MDEGVGDATFMDTAITGRPHPPWRPELLTGDRMESVLSKTRRARTLSRASRGSSNGEAL
jgi:hypothetical protein